MTFSIKRCGAALAVIFGVVCTFSGALASDGPDGPTTRPAAPTSAPAAILASATTAPAILASDVRPFQPTSVLVRETAKPFDITPTPASDLRPRLGRLMVHFPMESRQTRVEVYARGTDHKVSAQWAGLNATLLPGSYDVVMFHKRVPNVTIEAGKDTNLHVGVLRMTIDPGTKFIVRDADDKTELFAGYGKAVLALPVGEYYLVLAGTSAPLTIKDGEVFVY